MNPDVEKSKTQNPNATGMSNDKTEMFLTFELGI